MVSQTVRSSDVDEQNSWLAGRLQGTSSVQNPALYHQAKFYYYLSLSFLCIQGIAGDIQAHERAYKEERCSKCRELVARGSHDAEELQQKLDKFKHRWNALQVRQQ